MEFRLGIRKGITKIVSVFFFIFVLFSFSYSAIGSVLKEENKREILNKVYTLQIPFIENKGQIKDEGVKYYAKTLGGTVFITKDGKLVYSLPKYEKEKEMKGWVIKESLVGGSISDVKGEKEAITKVSYFKGKDPSNWKRNISTYNLVSLGEIYKGIELKLKAYGKNVEKLFYVKAGANPEGIKVKIDGAKGLKVNEKRELEIETALGVVKFTKPTAYQKENGKKKYVEVAYAVKGDEYSFKVADYDREKELVIDPLLASTFLGGVGDGIVVVRDYASSISIDSSGNVYVAGYTSSSDFPVTTDAYDTTYNSDDVFVSKLDSSLKNLLASTFLGGSGSELGCYPMSMAMSIDSSGNVYVVGHTCSSDFPVTTDAYDTTLDGGDCDAFVSKLDSDLSAESGDANGDGRVTIDEVQRCINQFLGIADVEPCNDLNGDGQVAINEVQKVINAYLGLYN